MKSRRRTWKEERAGIEEQADAGIEQQAAAGRGCLRRCVSTDHLQVCDRSMSTTLWLQLLGHGT